MSEPLEAATPFPSIKSTGNEKSDLAFLSMPLCIVAILAFHIMLACRAIPHLAADHLSQIFAGTAAGIFQKSLRRQV
ncbi:MAG: hypothetical protein WBA88_06535 [Pseudaminobacter sp.]